MEANQTARFVFTNSVKPSLNLIKLSSDGSRLAGVTFRIAKIEDGTHYLDRTTDENGEILISGLEPGVYSVKELDTTSDHIIDPVERHVELFPGKTSTIILDESDKKAGFRKILRNPAFLSLSSRMMVEVLPGKSSTWRSTGSMMWSEVVSSSLTEYTPGSKPEIRISPFSSVVRSR